MKVFFSVVFCVLIYSLHLLTSAQEISTANPTTNITDQPNEKTTTESAPRCINPIPPKNQRITANKTFANIVWDISQVDQECFPKNLTVNCTALEGDNSYGWIWVIKNSSGSSATIKANNTITVIIYNLSEFTNYTCDGTLMMSDEQMLTATQVKFTTESEVANEPLNLIVTGTTRPTIIAVKWDKPFKNPGIFEYYQIHIVSYGPNHYLPNGCEKFIMEMWNETEKEEFNFMHLHASYIYEISVFVKNSAGNGTSTSIKETTSSAASAEPREFLMDIPVLNEEENVITMNISWKMPCEPNGPINHFDIKLEDYYIPDNQTIHENSTLIPAASSEKYSMQIVLSPASIYTISIRANGENVTGTFYNETFETEANLPGVPRVSDITEKGSTFFIVSWMEPERRAGIITNYTVDVVSMMPLYDRDTDRCPFQIETFTELLTGDIRIYNFTKGHPYYKYNISITATTSKGDGEPSVKFVETEPSVPEKPYNSSFILMDNNTTGLISWRAPCNINGAIHAFSIIINGTYSDHHSSLYLEEPITVIFENGSYNYSYSVQLLEAYIYEAYIRVILKDGTNGEADITSVRTPDGYPGVPMIKNATNIEESSFVIVWDPPNKRAGRITYYKINITSLGPLYETHCSVDNSSSSYTEDGNITTFRFTEGEPYYKYSISITASTSRGFGNSSDEIFVITEQSIPETIQVIHSFISDRTEENEKYNASANISFEKPCRINGLFKNYELNIFGSRPNYMNHTKQICNNYSNSFSFHLKPEFKYNFTIKTINEYFNSTSNSHDFQAPAGVPKFGTSLIDLNIRKGSSTAQITLRYEYFDEENGDIKYIALIISEKNVTGENFNSWDGKEWPKTTGEDGDIYYQITDDWWYPFKDSSNITITVGNETNCDEFQNYCNKPLEKDKDYYLIIRIFTSNFYKNSPTIYFRTDDVSKLGMILGIIFGLLAFAVLGITGFFVWKKNAIKLPPVFYPRKSSIKTPSIAYTAIPIYKFVQYCKNLENNTEKLTEQYTLLAEKTKEAVRMQTTMYAELTENRRKNRYTNILPYDETRVKLLIDEDDEIGSDYINASYIRGYSGKVEYIATQGPLPTTCRDFWKMVIQENVSIIVMVTQFIEQNKEKCYKYFPNNHESMIIGEDMEVKCSMELHFGTYCVRTLQVKKDTTQVTVTHMQYLDWPDFNVPKGTENMLQFCYQLRERLKIERGYVIIHCSAGVGRTGTLIATDILLQNVNAEKNVDVFNTVLDLRKQRTHMVQTQKQFMYIHNLVKDSFDQSHTSGFNETSEPFYENLSVVKMKADDKLDNLIAKDKETESQF